jgi:hypothetical protein
MMTKISAFITLIGIFTFSILQSQSVLICGSPVEAVWLTDVQMKIQASGQFVAVDIFNTSFATPTAESMFPYDAILVFTDSPPSDAITFGNNIASYIDQGGGVVNCVFSMASVPIMGLFGTTNYAVAEYANAQSQDIPLSLGTIPNPNHPILNGVISFNGGSSSYHSPGTLFAPGSSVDAYWSNGQWLVATRENVGTLSVRRADLNFYPPSSDVRPDFWDASTNGALLMANALTWVMNGVVPGCTDASACNYNAAAIVDDGSCTFPAVQCYADADADGFGSSANSIFTCDSIAPSGYVFDQTDCNDADPNMNPIAIEVCNQIDDNCNNLIDEGLIFNNYYSDNDSDGFGAGLPIGSCADLGLGYVLDNTDCDDANSNVNPIAIEIGGNGIDENCDGQIDNSVIEISNNSFVLYPNPTNQFINVQVESYYVGKYYQVCNAVGDEVLNGRINGTQGILDLASLTNGAYFFKIEQETIRFILSR